MPTTIPPPVSLAELRARTAIPMFHPSSVSLAAFYQVSRATAYRMADDGQVPTIRVRGRRLVPVPALLRMPGADDLTEGQNVSPGGAGEVQTPWP